MTESVRFYSTQVSPEVSLGEVAAMLRRYGAQRFEQMWDGGKTTGVRFNLPTPEAAFGFIDVVLRPKTDVLADKLWKAHRINDGDQVERVAWRQLKGILEGILLGVDTGMFSAGQMFLGMAEDPTTGEPMWDVVCKRGIAGLLPAPEIQEAQILAIEEPS